MEKLIYELYQLSSNTEELNSKEREQALNEFFDNIESTGMPLSFINDIVLESAKAHISNKDLFKGFFIAIAIREIQKIELSLHKI